MNTNTKQKIKSCNCSACRAGRGRHNGVDMVTLDQRSYRRNANQQLRNSNGEDVVVQHQHKSNYYD